MTRFSLLALVAVVSCLASAPSFANLPPPSDEDPAPITYSFTMDTEAQQTLEVGADSYSEFLKANELVEKSTEVVSPELGSELYRSAGPRCWTIRGIWVFSVNWWQWIDTPDVRVCTDGSVTPV